MEGGIPLGNHLIYDSIQPLARVIMLFAIYSLSSSLVFQFSNFHFPYCNFVLSFLFYILDIASNGLSYLIYS